MKTKLIIGLLIGLILVSGCSKEQSDVKTCKERTGIDCRRRTMNEMLVDSEEQPRYYWIERHYDECILDNETLCLHYDPFEKWGFHSGDFPDYVYKPVDIVVVLEEVCEHFGIPVKCPEEMDYCPFCYKEWLRCNQTHHYNDGTKEKVIK